MPVCIRLQFQIRFVELDNKKNSLVGMFSQLSKLRINVRQGRSTNSEKYHGGDFDGETTFM